jgi:hypothetical protein
MGQKYLAATASVAKSKTPRCRLCSLENYSFSFDILRQVLILWPRPASTSQFSSLSLNAGITGMQYHAQQEINIFDKISDMSKHEGQAEDKVV